eukprot:1158339-Pelagomonas_calceolata.AAC.2
MSIFVFNDTSGRGYGQYRQSHPHPGGLWRVISAPYEIYCVVAVTPSSWAPGLVSSPELQEKRRPVTPVLLLTSSIPLILRTTRCEGEVGGLFGFTGQEVTKIASGRLELLLA